MWQDLMISAFGHQGASKDLEALAYRLLVIGTLCLVGGIFLFPLLIGVPIGALGAYMLQHGYDRNIPSSPPCKALLTIWGKRLEVVMDESEVFTADYYPFRIGLTIVPISKENFNFEFKGIRCRLETKEDDTVPAEGEPDPRLMSKKRPHSGGAITVKGSYTVGPDYSTGGRLKQFLDNGGMDGIRNQLEDIFGNGVRSTATERTWEEVTFLESPLSAAIAIRTTDANILKLPRDAEGQLIPQDQWPQGEAYRAAAQKGSRILDPVEYVDNPSLTMEERSARQSEIDWFLKEALIDGVADVHGIGAQITRISITGVEPEGKLKDDAEATAREIQQRTRDLADTDTGIAVADRFMDLAKKHGQTIPVTDAVRFAQVDRKRADQSYVNTNSDNPLVQAASVVKSGTK